MPNSLLKKVREAENEAHNAIVAAEEARQAELHSVRANEVTVLEKTRQQAEEKAADIKADLKAKANDKLNQVKQEQEKSVAAIKEAAGQNRDTALKFARDLFDQQYIA